MKKSTLLSLLLIALIAMGIASQNSPLYPLNPWPDTQTIYTVADGINHGQIMYRDLYDQKGPWMFFLYLPATWMDSLLSAAPLLPNSQNYFGLLLVELLFAFGFLLLCNQIFQLYSLRYPLLCTALVALLAYSSRSFFMGGSAEEFALAPLTYTLYLALRYVHKDCFPTFRQSLLAGALLGLVFYMKYTLLGFALPLVLLYLLDGLRKKQGAAVLRSLGAAFLGFVLISLPPLLYLAANGALGDFFTVYIYNNIFLYGKHDAVRLVDRIKQFLDVLWHNPLLFSVLGLGLAAALLRLRRLRLLLAASFVCCFISAYLGSRHYGYYDFVLCLFLPFVFLAADEALRRVRIPKLALTGIYVLLIPLFFKLSPNTHLRGLRFEETPQYQFAQIIRQAEHPTLLQHGALDAGFYHYAGVRPNRRYFCLYNVLISEVHADHSIAIRNGEYDFVVSVGEDLGQPHYKMVASGTLPMTNLYTVTYYLHQLQK